MKFSVCLATGYEGLVYPIPFCAPQDLIKHAVLCESLGYDAVFGNDHLTTQHYVREIFPEPPNFYDVLITLAMAGQATSKIRLGTSLLVMPMREPVMLAKQVATLDQMTGGRVILAVGLGAYREEFEAWAGRRFPRAHRGDMLEEGLAAFRTLIEDKVSSFNGKYYSFSGLELAPKPKQKPLALYIGGHNIAAIDRAAKIGRGWLLGWRPFHEIAKRIVELRRRAEGYGRDPGEIEVAPQFSLLIGKTNEAAEQTYMQSGLVAHRKSLAYTGRDPAHQVTGNLVGSPRLIIDKIHALKRMGVDHCAAMAIAVNSQQEYIEQIHWFAEEVMPHCR
jgi:probable F420-dependent oxidoreductase